MTWLRRVLARRRRSSLDPPPEHCPSGLAEAQAQMKRADQLLEELKAQEPAVHATAARAEHIHRQNNLGPAFMKALSERRT